MKPRILVPNKKEENRYSEAVEHCGGIPVWDPAPAPSHEGYDGLILCGGSDVDPALYGEEFPVNSSHHQSVIKTGQGMRVTQRSSDGCIEATEHETLPIISVQWHPEQMCFARARPDTVDGGALFRYFIKLCRH